MSIRYRVYWDNGASACGIFPELFDTEEEAGAYGQEWADTMNLEAFGTTAPEEEGYAAEVIEVDTVVHDAADFAEVRVLLEDLADMDDPTDTDAAFARRWRSRAQAALALLGGK